MSVHHKWVMVNTMQQRASVHPTTQKRFNEDGVALIPSGIDTDAIERLRKAVDRTLTQPTNYFDHVRIWENDQDCAWYCLESPIPALAATLLKSSKINLLFDQIFAKEAGAPHTPWHNDQPYWPIRGWPVMTVWLALDEVTTDSGALEFICGSHLWNRWFQPFDDGEDGSSRGVYQFNPEYEPLPDFDTQRERYQILSWPMNPGDILVFHGLTVHGARANRTPQQRRRGYAVRYAGKGTTYFKSLGMNPQLFNDQLSPGDPLDSEQYPVAYED